MVQAVLLRRILDHIVDPVLRRLTYDGLVLRRFTAEVIRYVLTDHFAAPDRVTSNDDENAQKIFDELSREVAFLSWNADGSLMFRPEIRRQLLPILEQRDPHRTRMIHSRAVIYYQARDDMAYLS